VIVYKFDRISRSVVNLYELLGEFEVAGVDFRSVTEGVDTGSAIGKFIMSIMASLAQMERELISERTRHTLATKKDRGEHVGHIPFGYKIGEDGCLEKDPERQKSIAAMKRARRNGKSIRTISASFGLPKSTVFDILNAHQNRRNAQYLR
jgi:DNA invertase Pin-like site-specific DNA recombinase